MTTIIGMIIKALSDSLLSALFNFIQSEMHDRGLIAQGQAQQKAADDAASTAEAKDAAQISEDVARDSDADLDAGLERVRSGSGAKR